MALGKHLLPLVLVVLFSSSQTQARESKFFSKFSHFQKPNTTNNPTTTITTTDNNAKQTEIPLEQVPAVKQEEEEPSFTPQTTNGYGLYGHQQQYTGGGYEDKALNNDNYGYKGKQFGMSDTRFMDNNNGYESKQLGVSDTRFLDNGNINNNNNGYETKEVSTSDSRFLDNGNNNNNNNGYETKQYGNKNQYYSDEDLSKNKQQGLSDTRFMENGKYYYNVNNQNSYLNGYQPESGSYNEFRSSQGLESKNKYNYGNNENAYEFKNSMGESQYQEEENQEEFSP